MKRRTLFWLLALVLQSVFNSTLASAHSNAAAFGGSASLGAPKSDTHIDEEPAQRLYPGTVVIDPRQVVNVVVKINARIRKLGDLYVGKRVKKGEALGYLESAELETIQKTYLSIVSNMDAVKSFSMTSNEKLIDGRMNLAWRGMSAEDIKHLDETREPIRLIAIRAPTSGYVLSVAVVNDQILNAGVQQGQYSAVGVPFATIAKMEAIGVEAGVPVSIAGGHKRGDGATVLIGSSTGAPKEIRAEVQQVFAFINPTNQRRTLRLQLHGSPAGEGLVNGAPVMVRLDGATHAH